MPSKRKREATVPSLKPSSAECTQYLTSLPQEILIQIAEYVMYSPDGISIRCAIPTINRPIIRSERIYLSKKRLLAFARVSRRMWRTCIPIFFSLNTFKFTYQYQNALKRFWCSIDEGLLAKITTLHLTIPQAAYVREALLSFKGLQNLKVSLLDHSDDDFFHRLKRQPWGLVACHKSRNIYAVILEVLCRELEHLRYVEIDADQYIWDGDVHSCLAPDSRNWGKVEQLVEEMRAILQRRDPAAVVRLYEWVSSRRMRKTAMDPGEVMREEMREYIKLGEYVTLIGRA